MVDFIYQVSTSKIKSNIGFKNLENLCGSDGNSPISWCEEIDDYAHGLNLFYEQILQPSRLFNRVKNENAFRLNRTLNTFRWHLASKIVDCTEGMNLHKCFNDLTIFSNKLEKLRKIIEKPFNQNSNALFYCCSYVENSPMLCNQYDFYDWVVKYMKYGDYLYVGGILKYHI